MRVRYSARSDIGQRREVNQDFHGESQGRRGTFLVVCDGMGGHAAGEVASRLAVEVILAACPPDGTTSDDLQQAFAAANAKVYSDGHGSMGTTGVAALLRENVVYVANVGDSRAYLVREGQITQLSRDHSFVSDQVAAGLMTPEQARSSNIRNIITRALGHQPSVEVDIFSFPLRAGDTIVLSTDGMHGLIEDTEIAEITGMLPPDQAAQRLIETANARGGNDNITVVIAQVDELDPDSPEPPAAAHTLATPAAPARPQPQAEPTLSVRGMLLAALTMLVLISMGSYVLLNSQLTSAPPATATSLPASPTPELVIVTATATPPPPPSPTTAPATRTSAPTASPTPTTGTTATP